ncbi:hypothetical protein GCM10022403_092370 [Streptomyces coacervatus]|uniref:Uncharacterized protein n=1 Tax=Streptomyces coacervatus TaxID=647381 RepID=A0ABP7JJM1_9ACTN
MLVINGADDVHVPRHDTLVFDGRRDTELRLQPDGEEILDRNRQHLRDRVHSRDL